MKKTIKVSRWECINYNGCTGRIFNTESEARAQVIRYDHIRCYIELTGSYEVDVPERTITITESELETAYINMSCFAEMRDKLFGGDQ